MKPLFFTLDGSHPLARSLPAALGAEQGQLSHRHFPDGESYLRIDSPVAERDCVILASLDRPDSKILPLCFLGATLRELSARSVGLVAPYLCYMRQDRRFHDGEAVTSRIFASLLSSHIDWLTTVDPHLHRYKSLSEIYPIPTKVVHGASLLAQWLKLQDDSLLLVGPDAESEQWVADIAAQSGQSFVIGSKRRHDDRDVEVVLPDLGEHRGKTAVIIDDVIASGQTLLRCLDALKAQKISHIICAAVHGIFADNIDRTLQDHGLERLITCNSIPHDSNVVDLTPALIAPVNACLKKSARALPRQE